MTAPRVVTPALEIRGVTVAYREKVAVADVDLEVPPGARVGIVGPNGAGKSTLLAAVVGLVRPRAGTVLVEGAPAARCRGRVAYLPQRQQIDWEHPARVRDVVAMGRYPHRGATGRLRRVDREAVDAALARVGLEAMARVRIAELSGGQQQRTFLARALAQQAVVLLLDEPYAGLDAATVAVVDRELQAAADEGVAVVVVNHDLVGLGARYDRVVVLRGRVVAAGRPAAVLRPEVLDAAYGPGAVLLADPGGAS